MLYVNRTFISNINTCISELQYFAHEVYVTTFRKMLRNKIYVLHLFRNKMERKMVLVPVVKYAPFTMRGSCCKQNFVISWCRKEELAPDLTWGYANLFVQGARERAALCSSSVSNSMWRFAYNTVSPGMLSLGDYRNVIFKQAPADKVRQLELRDLVPHSNKNNI